MKPLNRPRHSSSLRTVVLAAGAAALLLTTGCAASGTSVDSTPAASAATAAPGSTSAAAPPTGASAMPDAAPASASEKYAERLVLGSLSVKAGGTLSVSGGTLEPGITVKVYAAQQTQATYNPATDSYSGPGEVLISDTVNAVVDAQGHYDVQLLIPAGTPPQTMNVELITPDGNGNLVQANVT